MEFFFHTHNGVRGGFTFSNPALHFDLVMGVDYCMVWCDLVTFGYFPNEYIFKISPYGRDRL